MSLAISVDNLSKAYQLGQFGTGTISRDIERWWITTIRGKEDPFLKIGENNDRTKKGKSDIVWALDSISFDVQQGEVIGVIGRNGAGKSTLLKILSRTTSPTSGSVKIKGKIASLLEVGTGFHPELTGRENIFLNGAILGMTTLEIRKKFDQIVDFSGVERYIDTPVKRYSSGMYVRLAFAVAAHLEPDILVVDEVLAVGDSEFQKKCLGKMKEVSVNEGRTILFVSHNMSAISNLCNRAILLSSGRLTDIGSVGSVLRNYRSAFGHEAKIYWRNENKKRRDLISFKEISLQILGKQPNLSLLVNCKLISFLQHKDAFIAIDVSNSLGVAILQALPNSQSFIKYSPEVHDLVLEVKLPPLIPDLYYLSFWIGSHFTETLTIEKDVICFELSEPPDQSRTFPYSSDHGIIIAHSNVVSYERTR